MTEHTTEQERVLAPTAEEIERRFRGPSMLMLRPIVRGGLGALGVVRGYSWAAEGEERLLSCSAPVILASNHLSHADTAAILGVLPGRLRRRTCVAAALDVFGTSAGPKRTLRAMRRECLQMMVGAGFHAFAFDRHGPPLRSIRTATTLVRNGWNLLLYPEGTRSRSGALGPFKPGVGVIAKTTGRPVVPVYVSGGDTILPCGRTFPSPGHATVHFGEPLQHRRGESIPEFVDRLHARVQRLAPGNAAAASDAGRSDHARPDTRANIASLSTGDVREPSL